MASTTTSKELKALLKLARVALDKGDYEEAIKQCNVSTDLSHMYSYILLLALLQAVLWSDSTNYLANVIAGKANLLLQNVGEAKRLYKQAITINQDEMAAWKVMRNVAVLIVMCVSVYIRV